MEKEQIMFRSRLAATAAQNYVRGMPMMEGEKIVDQFSSDDGIVVNTPDKGDLLVLTNLRVIAFVKDSEHKETSLAPLDELNGLSVKSNNRGAKEMLQGPILILLGIVAYFVVGYSLEHVAVAAVMGASIALVGVLLGARFIFWEEEGTILFQGGRLELGFPYRTDRASEDAYKVVNRFFDLKLSLNSNRPTRVTTSIQSRLYHEDTLDDSHYDF